MKTALLVILQLASSGADAYFTNRNAMTPKFHERNPIAQPFMGSQASRVTYFSLGAAAKVTFPLVLRRKRPRMAKMAAIAGILDNAEGAVFSATH